MDKFVKLIKFLIDDEDEAIEGYKKVLKEIKDPDVKKKLEKIMNEEFEHKAILNEIIFDREEENNG